MPQVYKNDIVREVSRSQLQEYLAAGWSESAAVKKSKAKAEVAAPVAITEADSGSPEALASVTTQAPPGDIILDKGDE